IAHCAIRRPFLGLHVNGIQAELVFLDRAIHAAVAGATEQRSGIFNGSTVTPRPQQIDDSPFEKCWTGAKQCFMNFIDQTSAQLVECFLKRFLGSGCNCGFSNRSMPGLSRLRTLPERFELS